MRAFALWRADGQLRVQGWQALHSYHSGAKSGACETDRFSRSIIRVARLLDAVLPRPYTKIIQSF